MTTTATTRRTRVQLPAATKAVLHGAAAMISAARGYLPYDGGYLARVQGIVADLAEGNVAGAVEACADLAKTTIDTPETTPR